MEVTAEYKRDLNHNYMIIKSPCDVDMDSFQIRMLVGNVMKGFLSCRLHMLDNQALFYYEITSRQSLAVLYQNRMINAEILEKLVTAAAEALNVLDSYLLDGQGLVLRPEYIYLDAGNQEISFCYLPGYGGNLGEEFRALTEYLLPKIDHTCQEAVVLGYGIYRKAMEEPFDLTSVLTVFHRRGQESAASDFISSRKSSSADFSDIEQEKKDAVLQGFLEEEEGEEEPAAAWMVRVLPPAAAAVLLGILILLKWVTLPIWAYLALVGILLAGAVCGGVWLWRSRKAEEEKEIEQEFQNVEKKAELHIRGRSCAPSVRFEAGPEQEKPEEEKRGDVTVCLGYGGVGNPYLSGIQPPTLPTVTADRELILVGTLPQAVDVVLPSKAVSRMHAKIEKREGECYLTDLNSRNGTFVNEQPLVGEEERRLCDGDRVRFADLTYQYCK